MDAAAFTQKPAFRAAGCLTASVLTLFFACVSLWPRAVDTPNRVLAQRDGWAVLRGAPENASTKYQDRDTLLRGALTLVSPRHPLPMDAPPPETRSIRALVGSYLPVDGDAALCKEAVYALCNLQTEHSMTGHALLFDGAVSHAQQDQRQKDAFHRCQQVYPLSEALARAREAVPAGGESEHQTGWAIDVKLLGALSMGRNDPLERTDYGQWLKDSLWRYGFIRRYAAEGEEGACENIHLRYVGPLHAAAMHALGMTMEEYWALLRQEGALTVQKDGQDAAYLYSAPCGADGGCLLPTGSRAEFSADNTGWAAALLPVNP